MRTTAPSTHSCSIVTPFDNVLRVGIGSDSADGERNTRYVNGSWSGKLESTQCSVRNGLGRAGPDVFRPGLRALYQTWPAALSAGFSREKPGRPGSPSGPSDWL